jgi:hypothetical protein
MLRDKVVQADKYGAMRRYCSKVQVTSIVRVGPDAPVYYTLTFSPQIAGHKIKENLRLKLWYSICRSYYYRAWRIWRAQLNGNRFYSDLSTRLSTLKERSERWKLLILHSGQRGCVAVNQLLEYSIQTCGNENVPLPSNFSLIRFQELLLL